MNDRKPDLSDSEASGAFVEALHLEPFRAESLDGLTFTVKDNIDLGGHRTSFGSPAWRDGHPAALRNALCVDQLLAAGATCVGKVVADEFTYSLEGESQFFGTPLNARAPDRIPGGSSSGSASSVACGLADFSIGTDSGGLHPRAVQLLRRMGHEAFSSPDIRSRCRSVHAEHQHSRRRGC